MSVSFVGATSGNGAAATPTSFATTLHGSWLPGDVAVLSGHLSGTSLTMSVPGDWTVVPNISFPVAQSTNSRAYMWYRRLASGDSAPTITNSGSTTGGWTMQIFRGASGLFGQTNSGTASATSINNPSLTGCKAGSALASHQHARVASGTIPTGFTPPGTYTEPTNGDHATSRITSSANVCMEAAYRLLTADGNYGGDTFSVTNTITSSIVSLHVELLAASDVVIHPPRPRLSALIQM